jgi:hypothetical protein
VLRASANAWTRPRRNSSIALGSSESHQRREVRCARGTAPPCGPGSSKNRQRRAVWSRFLRLLVVLISISRPWQSARSGWVIALHVIDAHVHWPADHVIGRIRLGKTRASIRCGAEPREWRRTLFGSRRKPEFEQLGLLIETAAVENRRADRGICRWPRDRRQ